MKNTSHYHGFDQDSAADIDNNEKRIPYRLCYKDRIKVITTRPVNEVQINKSTFYEPEITGGLTIDKGELCRCNPNEDNSRWKQHQK